MNIFKHSQTFFRISYLLTGKSPSAWQPNHNRRRNDAAQRLRGSTGAIRQLRRRLQCANGSRVFPSLRCLRKVSIPKSPSTSSTFMRHCYAAKKAPADTPTMTPHRRWPKTTTAAEATAKPAKGHRWTYWNCHHRANVHTLAKVATSSNTRVFDPPR